MKKKNGFIAISIIYSFFLCFVMLVAGLLANYASAKIILNKANEPLTFEVKDGEPVEPEPDPDVPDEPDKILLRDKIMADNKIKTEIPDFNDFSTGFYSSNDNDGISYYFRGDINNNYVQFGGGATDENNDYRDLIWRIVRINGDKSIRLALDNNISNANNTIFNYSELASALGEGADFYVGYTYNNPHDCTNENPCYKDDGTSSTIKKYLEDWYKITLERYGNKISYSTFCNDTYVRETIQTLPSVNNSRTSDEVRLYGITKLFDYSYSSNLSGRNWIGDNLISKIPRSDLVNYTCSNTNQNYGGIYKLKIGLLTAQEIIMAGVGLKNEIKTPSYLLSNSTKSIWTMTPLLSATPVVCNGNKGMTCFTDSVMITLHNVINSKEKYQYRTLDYVNYYLRIKPVINLDKDVYWSGNKKENGTKDHPYTIIMD